MIVPAHLTMDAAENRKTMAAAAAANKDKILSGRRHTVSGANPVAGCGSSDRNAVRPSNLPMQIGPTSEPIPVPTQKAAYQQIQQRYVC